MNEKLFPLKTEATPKIYAYEDTNPQYKGLLKVGYTIKNVEERVKQQYPTLRPEKKPYRIVLEETAIRYNGTSFTDHDVHRLLRKQNFYNPNGEWFKCSVEDVMSAILSLKSGNNNLFGRSECFSLRKEQEEAIEKTSNYFNNYKRETGRIPHFLWNAKMRFGKTFTTYKLAERMQWKRLLILTFKPAVVNSWEEDLNSHVDFSGWQFVSRQSELSYENADKEKPIVCFGSFQDYLGTSNGKIKKRNQWVHEIQWDCIVFDEYHYGAWRENARALRDTIGFVGEDTDSDTEIKKYEEYENDINKQTEEDFEENIPITANHYLYLSGTPFRAILSGEFIEEQIFNWTYSDEQKAKEEWAKNYPDEKNPYLCLPRMVMMTYKIPDDIRQIAEGGEYNEFDLNSFFKAEGEKDEAKFVYKDEVQKWLNLIRGSYLETTLDDLKLGAKKPKFPFSDTVLLNNLNHTLWFLPNVASCYAMRNLLNERQNTFYHDYKIVVAAGVDAGLGVDAIRPVNKAFGKNPLKSKSITLSCGKLTTGVTIKPWTGVFMLRNTTSAETYFQTAFRVQSPWILKNPDDVSPNKEEIIKKECYIFDFAPNRALNQIVDYSDKLNVEEQNHEKKVAEFISFLPVLAYDGSTMKRVNATEILDIALSGTTSTLLARRWQSALLVNVDNNMLKRLLANEEAINIIMNIEGFRSLPLKDNIETIINKSESVKNLKKKNKEEGLDKKEKKQLSDEEKEYQSKRKEIRDKLIKFATRIPIFMYLSDFREYSLQDVINKLEPNLFKKVTGLTKEDFSLLVSMGLFNESLMNDAVFKFKRYEDSSLRYVGINRYENENIGGYNTQISAEDFDKEY